ncbi:DNA-binding transcriptional regulator, AcrR family [Evansella caseinilytica]|uniref:DNA-binding transcriptional regulator, AcrR family n=1 Tax=Evansella caseinilytica TaxID=1503961 RepID=A0A1H3URN8_9BACI|nr:TetR/AcrR family transcriptional regulator [Evansella caseinilytica]SDZ64691.1 DNA-binding transcriptional regulator, AcrR family [Evansella caseinilytica]
MDGYQVRTEKKKESIRKAALELFTNLGIDKVSQAEIAKKANVSPVTIYNHFGTKDELVFDVISGYIEEEWKNRMETCQRKDISFHKKIEKLIFDTADSSNINPEFLDTIVHGYPALAKRINEIYNEYMPRVIAFLEAGKQSGYVDPDLSAESILVYLQLLGKVANELQFTDDQVKNSKLAKDMAKMFFYGLLRNPDEK